MAETEKPDYIILSETHLTKDIEENEIRIKNYDQYTTLSNSSRTGGVIIYIKSIWKIDKICDRISDSNYWMSAYVAKHEQVRFIIMAVYRSPSSNKSDFSQAFEDILEEVCEENCDIVIAGDFNIDWNRDEFYKEKMENIIKDNGLKQIINENTRITKNTQTLIDYVITNSKKITAKTNIKRKIADHETIDIFYECEVNKQEKRRKEIEVFKYDKNQFEIELSALLKLSDKEDVNSKTEIFDMCLYNAIRKFTHKKIISENNNNKWFTKELRILQRDKCHKYQIALIENSYEAWNNYKTCRNRYKVEVENQKDNYVNNKVSNAKDQKEMWKQIKDLVLKKCQNVIQTVIFDNIEYKDNKEIANKFNQYFVDSIQEIRNSIENVIYISQQPVINTKFTFTAITIQELRLLCKNMKNKCDNDKVSVSMILDNWNTAGKALLDIINKSLETGVFPEKWKESVITPVQKVEKTKKCEEYRPINALGTCEKILEKVVKNQLEGYMEQNKYLYKHQSGFRKGFSCETAVNYIVNRWKYREKNNKIMALFLDLKRAFETIDREILLKKLYNYGVKDTEFKWFKSYMTNRKQRTKVNNIKSSKINNEYGVPQGSILGPLLFIVYINDLPNILKNCEIIMYADDTLIFNEDDTEENCREKLMQDINNVILWMKMNKLKLNEKKTKLMEINIDSNIQFKINDEVIEKVKSIKYLGFIIDKELKFKEHIEYICKKIGKKIGFFKRIRNKISVTTAINICNTMIKPHFEYCSTILYICCTNAQMERLQKLQNKVMRVILKCSRYTSIQIMLGTLKWLNIRQRLEMNTLSFIQKMKMGYSPDYLREHLQYIGDVQPYDLRNAQNFRIQRVTTTSRQNTLFYKGLQLYNMLPNELKNERNYNNFKRDIIPYIRYGYT